MPCDSSSQRRSRVHGLALALVCVVLSASGAAFAQQPAATQGAPDSQQAQPAAAGSVPTDTGAAGAAAANGPAPTDAAAPADSASTEAPVDTRGLDEEIQGLATYVEGLHHVAVAKKAE